MAEKIPEPLKSISRIVIFYIDNNGIGLSTVPYWKMYTGLLLKRAFAWQQNTNNNSYYPYAYCHYQGF